MEKPICRFYLHNRCKNGNNCPFRHENPQNMQPNSQPQQHNPNICKFFLTNTCNRQNCTFFHGHGNQFNQLQHVETIQDEKEINNLIKMDDKKFVASNEQGFTVRFIGSNEPAKETLKEEGFKIGKMIFSGNKVIFGLKKETL
jgi:hypothetical protein